MVDGGIVCYNLLMSTIEKTDADVRPKSTPSPAEIAAWDALPRDEQLRRLRESFEDHDCSRPSTMTMADILENALAAAKHE